VVHLLDAMKTLGKSFLTLWLASWLLAALQPCCEAVAETLPHHQNIHQSVQTGQHVHSGHLADHQSLSSHDHCGSKPLKLFDLVSPPSEQLQISFVKPKFNPVIAIPTFINNNTSDTGHKEYNYHPPPPTPFLTRLYLVTQRLRI